MDFKYMPRLFMMSCNDDDVYSLSEDTPLQPVKMSVTNKVEPPSTASITVDDSCTAEIRVGMFILVPSPVKTEMMYIKSIQTDYFNGNQRTLTCEGVWGKLAHALIYGKLTPSTINSRWSKKAASNKCFAADAVRQVLKQANETLFSTAYYKGYNLFDWSADRFGFANIQQGWSFNGVSCMSALKDVTDCLRDYEWDIRYDRVAGNIKIGLVKRQTSASCELRQSRNCKSLKVTVDMSGYYSAIFPVGKNERNITSVKYYEERDADGYLVYYHNSGSPQINNEKAANKWGYVASQVTDNTKSYADDVFDWGLQELKRHSEPAVSISVDALQLSQLTGSPFDRLVPGNRCRIPLPQYGVTFEDRIVECQFSDLVADEYSCKLKIANEREQLKDVIYKTGGGGGGKKRNNETDCDLHDATTKANTAKTNAETAKAATDTLTGSSKITLAGKTVSWKSLWIDGTEYFLLRE